MAFIVFSGKGLSRGLGEKSSPGPGCFCTPCPSKPETKLRPRAPARASGHGGGGGVEAASRVADSFLLSSSTLFEGRAPRLVQLPSPPSEKEKDTWEIRSISSSSSFNNTRCLPSDRSEREAGWAIEGPREIRSSGINPERHTLCCFQITFVISVFSWCLYSGRIFRI